MTDPRHLHILWTTGDSETARHMVLMYARNSLVHGWWDAVTVILWGAADRLVASDAAVQEEIRLARSVGVTFTACVACARNLGVLDRLAELGIETKGWGAPLTELLNERAPLITI